MCFFTCFHFREREGWISGGYLWALVEVGDRSVLEEYDWRGEAIAIIEGINHESIDSRSRRRHRKKALV